MKQDKELKKHEKFEILQKMRGWIRYKVVLRADHLECIKNRAFEHELSIQEVLEDILNREFNVE